MERKAIKIQSRTPMSRKEMEEDKTRKKLPHNRLRLISRQIKRMKRKNLRKKLINNKTTLVHL